MRQIQITQSITNSETRSVETYFKEIGEFALIAPEEEVILAKKIKQGDRGALEKLTTTNLRFVVSVAKKYQNMGIPLNDLISEGNLGLISAAKKFDETKGFKFISYAVWWIRQSILEALAEQPRMIRLPMNQVNEIVKINKAVCALEQVIERTPTPAELAEFLGTSTTRVTEALHISPRTGSYDALAGGADDSRTLLETIADQESRADWIMLNESSSYNCNSLLSTLSDRERLVIELSFGLTNRPEMSPGTIAKQIDMCGESVRQIKMHALQKMRLKVKLLELSTP